MIDRMRHALCFAFKNATRLHSTNLYLGLVTCDVYVVAIGVKVT